MAGKQLTLSKDREPSKREDTDKLESIDANVKNALYEGLDRQEIVLIFNKTENGLDKLGDMRGERFKILAQYKKTKDYKEKQKNNAFRFLNKKQTGTPKDILNNLKSINKNEQILARALTIDIKKNLPILQKGFFDLEKTKIEIDREVIDEFNNNIISLSNLGKRYIELSREHKNILEYEKQFIDNPNDSTFDTYVDKLAWFKGEFEYLISKESKDLTQYFQNIKDDLTRIRTALDNKTPIELIKTSCVSAIARVLVANMLGVLITGHSPMENKYFWELTIATMPAVAVLNYLDYYYSMFAKLTKAIVK